MLYQAILTDLVAAFAEYYNSYKDSSPSPMCQHALLLGTKPGPKNTLKTTNLFLTIYGIHGVSRRWLRSGLNAERRGPKCL